PARISPHVIADAASTGTTGTLASHRHTFAARRILRLPSARVMTNGARRPAFNANGHANGSSNGNGNGNGHGNGHTNGATVRPAWWRVVIPTRERQHRGAKAPRLPLRRRAVAFTANGYRLVGLSG